MRNKTYILVILILSLCLPLTAQAEERTFPAGSLVIPMDTFYQPEADGGILEAYGVIYSLLGYVDADGEHQVTIYWAINQDKTTIDGNDVVIEDLTLEAGEAVAKLYDHAGGTSALTFRTGDSNQRISYSGGPFIIDGIDAVKAKTIINQSGWSAVEVHEVQVPFSADIFREMRGTPPNIAVMDSKEDGGNAKILVNYLRLAGICPDNYDVVTPNGVMDGILIEEEYDLLWVPHWHGDDTDANANGQPDVVEQVERFVKSGKGLVAECASIREFEDFGFFLTPNGVEENGGDEEPIIYHDLYKPNSQIGDYEYEGTGGSLQNWRPITGTSYRDTVTRFVVNDENGNGVVDDTDWDWYVGGYAFADTRNGYVVYLGGHSYANCGTPPDPDPEPNVTKLLFEWTENIDTGTYTLLFTYNGGSTTEVSFTKLDLTAKAGDPLEVDLTEAIVNGKKLENVTLSNNGSAHISVDSITFSWVDESKASQKIKKIVNTKLGETIYDKPELLSPGVVPMAGELELDSILNPVPPACTDNDDCSADNVAAVRYMLNTLFNIKYQISSREYVRAAPVVRHPYLYQGSFLWPNYKGHFRRYDVTDATWSHDSAGWDTGDAGKIASANAGNSDGRDVYTAKQNVNGSWSKIDFDAANIAELRVPLDVTPTNGDDSDEINVITRLRGKSWNSSTSQWVERSNKLGGIMHSAPAIVFGNSRTSLNRDEVAYVGDLYGMLHAIDTSNGTEKWAFIPSNLLGKLQNDRSDPNAVQDFAAVDGSPTVEDVYYDHDNDDDKEFRTILVSSQGQGGRHLFALDITDPDSFTVLWELTVDAILDYTGTGGLSAGDTVIGQTSNASGTVVADDTAKDDLTLEDVSGEFQDSETVCFDEDDSGSCDAGEATITVNNVIEMGSAYRVALNKVKWSYQDVDDEDDDSDTTEILTKAKWVVFVATGHARIVSGHGGVNVFAFDLLTGDRLWYFSEDYADAVNDTAGAVTTFDIDEDGLVDRVYVGDMNGRMWELNAVDGTNPNGTETVGGVEKQIPLWNAGVGNPISVSPAITRINPVILVFGTGGTDWAASDQAYKIIMVNASDKQTSPTYAGGAGTLLWEKTLAVGEKVWSAPTIAAGQVYIATAFGTMESGDPRDDVPDVGDSTGNLYSLDLKTGNQSWSLTDVGKTRGSVFVDRQHVYLTTIDNQLKQIGGDDFSNGQANNVTVRDWRDF